MADSCTDVGHPPSGIGQKQARLPGSASFGPTGAGSGVVPAGRLPQSRGVRRDPRPGGPMTTPATEAYRAARDLLLAQPRGPGPCARGVRLARRRRAVQLGGRLVRRDRARQRQAGAGHRRGGRQQHRAHLRRDGACAPTRSRRGWPRQGVRRGDAVVVMLGNQVELWESMLAIMKLGAVIMPTTTAVGPGRPRRPHRARGGAASWSATPPTPPSSTSVPGDYGRICVGSAEGWAAARRVRPRRTPGRAPGHRTVGPAAALLHLRHDLAAQARRAHPGVLPGRAPRHDVLARPAPRRRAPEHLLARLGQARLVAASSRRGSRRRRSSSTTTRASTRARCSRGCASTR